jgi:hypothetical protein
MPDSLPISDKCLHTNRPFQAPGSSGVQLTATFLYDSRSALQAIQNARNRQRRLNILQTALKAQVENARLCLQKMPVVKKPGTMQPID